MEIAQITFSMLSSPPSRNYRHVGRFAKDNWNHFVPPRQKDEAWQKESGAKIKSICATPNTNTSTSCERR